MPREGIELDTKVPHVAILDADGRLDEDGLIDMLHQMVLARRFDERRLRLQRQGSIETFAPVRGQEAANLGPISVLEDRNWFLQSFREPAAAVYRGSSLEQILLYDAGFNEGARVPEGGRDFPPCVPVASQMPHAVGIAHVARLRGSDEVAMVYFGNGATSEGDFHEALNFAGMWNSPVIFVCQNNQWALSVPREEQTASKTLAQKAIGFIRVPGWSRGTVERPQSRHELERTRSLEHQSFGRAHGRVTGGLSAVLGRGRGLAPGAIDPTAPQIQTPCRMARSGL